MVREVIILSIPGQKNLTDLDALITEKIAQGFCLILMMDVNDDVLCECTTILLKKESVQQRMCRELDASASFF